MDSKTSNFFIISKSIMPILLIIIGAAIILLSFFSDHVGIGGPPGYGYREFDIALSGFFVLFIGIVWLLPLCQRWLRILVLRCTSMARVAIFSIPFFIILGAVIIYLVSPPDYRFITHEDSYIENATALTYFIAFIAALVVGRRIWAMHRLVSIMYCALALGLLLVGLEEISWGQRIFEIDTPEFVKQHNMQGELNIHNLAAFQTNKSDDSPLSSLTIKMLLLVGIYGSFLWFFVPRSINSKHAKVVELLVPAPLLMVYFLPIIISIVMFYYFPDGIGFFVPGNNESEIAELILALGFLVFVLGNLGQCPEVDNTSVSSMDRP